MWRCKAVYTLYVAVSLQRLTCCHNRISMDYSTISERLDVWLINFSASCLTTGLLCTVNVKLCHIKIVNSYKILFFDLIKCSKKRKSVHAIHTQLIQCRYFKGMDVFAGHLNGNRRPHFEDLSRVQFVLPLTLKADLLNARTLCSLRNYVSSSNHISTCVLTGTREWIEST